MITREEVIRFCDPSFKKVINNIFDQQDQLLFNGSCNGLTCDKFQPKDTQ